MEFLVRFVQSHEQFRIPELEALAELNDASIEIVEYNESSPFCIVRLPSSEKAKKIASRAILCKAVYELWGRGSSYDELHNAIRQDTTEKWAQYMQCSFRFTIDSFQGSRKQSAQRNIIESFAYLGFAGPIRMGDADEEFMVMEAFEQFAIEPYSVYFGRFLGNGAREIINRYTLKKRGHLASTSMDSELALIGANLALADVGKLAYDPFMGTGSLPLACSHFGAIAYGSDIDPRPMRGSEKANINTNFKQYHLYDSYLGCFVADLTHSPFRSVDGGLLDIIVCDPPYGVREGLRVLGRRNGRVTELESVDGRLSYLSDDYVAPKRPYSFDAMLIDILNFAACMLVDKGRLSFWMPTANEDNHEINIPNHPALEMKSSCAQVFNKWSRRLLTYQRIPGAPREAISVANPSLGGTADDLNNFRKRYFEGFKPSSEPGQSGS